MAHSAYFLPCNCENPRLRVRYPHRKLDVVCTCGPSAEEVETGGSLGTTGQPAWSSQWTLELQVKKRSSLKAKVVILLRTDT